MPTRSGIVDWPGQVAVGTLAAIVGSALIGPSPRVAIVFQAVATVTHTGPGRVRLRLAWISFEAPRALPPGAT